MQYDIADYLINQNADIELTNSYKTTPLLTACEWGNLPMVKLLVKNKANINGSRFGSITPLVALMVTSLPVTEYIIDKGANLYIVMHTSFECVVYEKCCID